jgi:hypothetical protein
VGLTREFLFFWHTLVSESTFDKSTRSLRCKHSSTLGEPNMVAWRNNTQVIVCFLSFELYVIIFEVLFSCFSLFLYVGGPKKPAFLSKIRFIYISNKKHLIPFKILSTGGNTLVQPFFPLCEASLELPIFCYLHFRSSCTTLSAQLHGVSQSSNKLWC